MAVTADLERMTRIVDGNPVPRVLRCTQVYRIEDGKWRIVHRHADDLRPAARST
jgi:ketosteroid isomerase-like protein